MKDNINNIHDKFVRESFSDAKRAAASLATILPADLVSQLDLSNLTVSNESYLNKELQEYFSDLVFEVPVLGGGANQELDVVLLFEHKSAPDKYVLFQVGYYLFAHYWKVIRSKSELKLVIPIIYYQGKKKWDSPDLMKIFKNYPITIQAYTPEIRHIFVALHSLSDEVLLSMQHALMASAMMAQKWKHEPENLTNNLIKILSIFKGKAVDWNFFEVTFVYIIHATEMEIESVHKVLDSVPSSIKENIMTTYAKILEKGEQIGIQKGEQIGIQKGEQIGIQKGEQKKVVEVVLALHEDGFSVDQIAKYAKVSEEQVLAILKEFGKL